MNIYAYYIDIAYDFMDEVIEGMNSTELILISARIDTKALINEELNNYANVQRKTVDIDRYRI